jgi:thiamine biosynthesis lipoprotein
MKRPSSPVFLLLPAFLALLGASCSRRIPAQRGFALGTVCILNLFEAGTRADYGAVFAELQRIQGIMAFSPGGAGASALDLINRNAGIRAVAAPEELLDILERARYYAELSGGAFDPTVGPLVRLWDVGGENPRLPGAGEIQEALDLVDWRDLLIDRESGTAFLRRRGQALDLGAIAKGYAADRAAALLRALGKRRAIIDLGGNILAMGERQGGGTGASGSRTP